MKESTLIFSQASLDKTDRSVRFHSHPGIEMILVTEGEAEIVVEKERCECRPGSLLIIPPESQHNQVCRGHFVNSFVVFFCSPELFDDSFRHLDVTSEPWCTHLFLDVCRLSEERRYELCEGVLRSLLLCISGFEKKLKGRSGLHPALHRAVERFEQDFRSPISMEELAGECQISYTYLRKLFDRQFRISPMHYLQNCRMAHARKLLLDSYLSVGEVAEQCGYPDANYFSRLFHRIHRCPPNEYRRITRERPEPGGTFIRM